MIWRTQREATQAYVAVNWRYLWSQFAHVQRWRLSVQDMSEKPLHIWPNGWGSALSSLMIEKNFACLKIFRKRMNIFRGPWKISRI